MRRTKVRARRVALVVLVLAAMGVSVGGLHVYRQSEVREQASALRAEGVMAYEAGRYREAAEHLEAYLHRYDSDDGQVWLKLGRARLQLTHYSEAEARRTIAVLVRSLAIEPDQPEVSRALLGLYEQVSEHERGVALASRLIATDPEDVTVRQTHAALLATLGRDAEALAAAETCLELAPTDWRMHVLRLQLLREQGESPRALIDEARRLQEAYPNEPGLKLLKAVAYSFAEDRDGALRWLVAAAEGPSTEEGFTLALVDLFDQMHQYADSLATLERHVDVLEDGRAGRELAWRLFEHGRFDDLLERSADVAMSEPGVNADLVALCAVAKQERGDLAGARELVDVLSEREADRLAAAWVVVLELVGTDDTRHLGAVLGQLQEAFEFGPLRPWFFVKLAEVYAAGGEYEIAISLWRHVSDERPHWSISFARQAELYVALGRVNDAVAAARAGYQRQPERLSTGLAMARAWDAYLRAEGAEGEFDPAGVDELMKVLFQVQEATPGEPTTGLLRLAWLLRLGHVSEAEAWGRSLLERGWFVRDGDAMVELMRIGQAYEMAFVAEAKQVYEQQHGWTAALALNEAMTYARAGEVDAGLELLRPGVSAASLGAGVRADKARRGEAVAWQLAWARYLEAVGDERAAEAWGQVAAEYPTDVAVQLEALRSEAMWSDRALVDATIDRLAEAMGEVSVNWRVARARWLLEADDAQRRTGRVIDLLDHVQEVAPNRLEPRLLLARAQQMAGRGALALEQLREAARRHPDAMEVQLQIAELQYELAQYTSARQRAAEVAASERADAEQRERARAVLARLESE